MCRKDRVATLYDTVQSELLYPSLLYNQKSYVSVGILSSSVIPTGNDMTPIEAAARYGRTETVRMLVQEHDADSNLADEDRKTPV